ncbi:hypothetical protein HID58_017236 [Brassica napus]|uniref:Pentatricopeptide repeat-containing protein n=1 Tax=Brassica napus TaxID=3708 RepID=A0ABQ8D6I6_BRANA|nr:hypothetical protein HID58_017236 [Brassica napus]
MRFTFRSTSILTVHFKKCSSSSASKLSARHDHGLMVKRGDYNSLFLQNKLLQAYTKSRDFYNADKLFDEMPVRNVVTWNIMIHGAIHRDGDTKEKARIGFCYLRRALLSEVGLDHVSFIGLIRLCSDSTNVEAGIQLHSLIHAIAFKLSFQFDIPVATALVDMYAKSNHMRDARECFESMVVRNVVSWNAMIVGYGQNGEGREAVRLLGEMRSENHLQPDELTFASVLSSCAKFSAVQEVKQVQAVVIKQGYECFLSVANSLVTAYSKSGSLSEALVCFHSIKAPDLVSWTSVIGALAFHGFAEESLRMFESMVQTLHPDKITFLEVMSACSHGGLVQEGIRCLKLMTEVYKMEPEEEHYTCLIDLLGRAGFIDEALDVLRSMPIEPRADALAAFTGACNIHEKRESMKWGAKKLLEIELSKPVNYSLLSKAYVSEGHWNQAATVRITERRNCNNPKTPGCSWLGD